MLSQKNNINSAVNIAYSNGTFFMSCKFLV